MTPSRPRPGPRVLAAGVLLALVLSQPGHALAYLWEYGGNAFAIQSQGVHGYFPAALNISLGLVVTLALGIIAVLGLARVAIGTALGFKRSRMPSPAELIAVMLIVQVNVFVFQELAEAQAAREFIDAGWLLHTGLLAVAGQAPVAIAGALGLAWCSVRLEAAVGALRSIALVRISAPAQAPVLITCTQPADVIRLETVYPAAFAKRGPPPRRSSSTS